MSNIKNTDSEQAGYGCLILLVIGVFGSVIIQVIQALITLAIIGGIGFLIYKLIIFDQRTGNITCFFENMTDGINNAMERQQNRPRVHYLEQQKVQQLPAGQQDELLTSLGKLANVIEEMNKKLDLQDNKFKELEESLDQRIEIAIDNRLKREKEATLNNYFTQKKEL